MKSKSKILLMLSIIFTLLVGQNIVNAVNISKGYDVSVKITDQAGHVVSENDKTYEDQQYDIAYNIKFDNSTSINNGSTITLNEPLNIKVLSGYQGNITNNDGKAVGTNQKVTLTFNNYFENHPLNKNVHLHFIVTGTIKPYRPGQDTDLKKLGLLLNDDKGIFSGHIQWTAQYNVNKNKLTNIEFIDTPESGHVIDKDSVKVYDLDDNKEIHPSVTYTESGFSFVLPETDHTLKLIYTSKVTNYSQKTWKNVITSTQTTADGKNTKNVDSAKVSYNGEGTGIGELISSSSEKSSLSVASSSKKSSSIEASSSKKSSSVTSSSDKSSSTEASSSKKSSLSVTSSSDKSSSTEASSSKKSSLSVASSSDKSSSTEASSSKKSSSTVASSSDKSSSTVASSSDKSSSSVVSSSEKSSATVASSSNAQHQGIVVVHNNNGNGQSGNGNGTGSGKSNGNGVGLPQTGEQQAAVLAAIGFVTLCVAGAVALRKRK